MTAEQPAKVGSGGGQWTLATLREHLVTVITANDRRYTDRFEALHLAERAAETALEKRLDGMNEFRQALSDQARALMPRAESDLADKVLAEKIADQAGEIEALRLAQTAFLTQDAYQKRHEELQRQVDVLEATVGRARAEVGGLRLLATAAMSVALATLGLSLTGLGILLNHILK